MTASEKTVLTMMIARPRAESNRVGTCRDELAKSGMLSTSALTGKESMVVDGQQRVSNDCDEVGRR